MSSDTISKNKLVVQDDFFNEIVDGLKSPVEEKIETQDAKSSRVELGGKQLTLFRGKVAPILGEEIGKNQMIQDYMQHVSDSYEKKKIQQMHEEYLASLKEYSIIEREIDDEIDEMRRDKKGQEMFLFQGFKILKTIRRMMSIYDLYNRMKAQIQESENKNTFNLDDYDLKDEKQRKEVYKKLEVHLHNETYRLVPMTRPILEIVTQSIFDASEEAFKKINDAIYWEIKMMLIQIGIEVGFSVALSLMSGGVGAGVWGKVGMSIANLMRRVGQILSVGLKFGSIANRIYRLGRVGRGTMAVVNGVGRFGRSAGRFVFNHRQATWNSLKWGYKGAQVLDLLDVTDEDVENVSKWARDTCAPYRRRMEAQWNVIRNDVSTIQSVSSALRNASNFIMSQTRNRLNPIYRLQTQRYNTDVEIENLKLDLDKIGELIHFLEHPMSEEYKMVGDGLFTKNENRYTFVNSSLEFDQQYGRLNFSHRESERNVINFTLNSTSGGGVFGTNRYIRLNEELANKGVEFQYGRFGSISGVRLHFQYNPRFLGTNWEGKYVWRQANIPDEWRTVQDLLYFYDNGTSLGQARQSFNKNIYFYVNGKKYVGEISKTDDGDGIRASIDGYDGGITVKHLGNFIDINGFGKNATEFVYKKKNAYGDEWVVIEDKSIDLHELVNFRNEWYEKELYYGRQVEKLNQKIIEKITSVESLEQLREDAFRAIRDRNTRLKRERYVSTPVDGEYEIKTYVYGYENENHLRNIIQRMTNEELQRSIKVDDFDDTEQLLNRYSVYMNRITIRNESGFIEE